MQNFYDENGNGVITKKDLKALKKAGYLGDLTPAQAYKQLDVNKDGVADPYEAARILGGGLSNGGVGGGGTLPFGFSANPYGFGGMGAAMSSAGFGAGYPMPPPPNAFQGFGTMGGGPGVPGGLNGINGLNNYPAYPQDFLNGGFGGGGGGPAGGMPGGFGNGYGY